MERDLGALLQRNPRLYMAVTKCMWRDFEKRARIAALPYEEWKKIALPRSSRRLARLA